MSLSNNTVLILFGLLGVIFGFVAFPWFRAAYRRHRWFRGRVA